MVSKHISIQNSKFKVTLPVYPCTFTHLPVFFKFKIQNYFAAEKNSIKNRKKKLKNRKNSIKKRKKLKKKIPVPYPTTRTVTRDGHGFETGRVHFFKNRPDLPVPVLPVPALPDYPSRVYPRYPYPTREQTTMLKYSKKFIITKLSN